VHPRGKLGQMENITGGIANVHYLLACDAIDTQLARRFIRRVYSNEITEGVWRDRERHLRPDRSDGRLLNGDIECGSTKSIRHIAGMPIVRGSSEFRSY